MYRVEESPRVANRSPVVERAKCDCRLCVGSSSGSMISICNIIGELLCL